MFCPKCGKQLPDEAHFCGGCGHRLANSVEQHHEVQPQPMVQPDVAAPQPQVMAQPGFPAPQPTANRFGQSPAAWPSMPQAQAMSANGAQGQFATAAIPSPQTQTSRSASVTAFAPVSIVARVAAVATLVCMFLPWLTIPALNTLGSLGSMVGLDTARDYSYSMIALGDAIDMVNSIANSSELSGTYTMFLVVWAAAVVTIVGCLIASFVGKKSARPLIAGGVLAALVALVWLAVISTINAQFSSQLNQVIGVGADLFEVPPAVFLTALFGIATTVLAALSKPAITATGR